MLEDEDSDESKKIKNLLPDLYLNSNFCYLKSQIELNQILNRVGKKQVGLKVTGKELALRIGSGQVLGALDNTKLDNFLVKLYSFDHSLII